MDNEFKIMDKWKEYLSDNSRYMLNCKHNESKAPIYNSMWKKIFEEYYVPCFTR